MEERDEYMCPSCLEVRDVEKISNKDGLCDWCNSEICPDCGSSAVGYTEEGYECLSCDHTWG